MSVYGIDIGGTNIVIGEIDNNKLLTGGIGCEILLNDNSVRKTPYYI